MLNENLANFKAEFVPADKYTRGQRERRSFVDAFVYISHLQIVAGVQLRRDLGGYMRMRDDYIR